MKQLLVLLVMLCVQSGIAGAADPAAPELRPVANPESGIHNLEPADAITIPGLISYQGRLTDTLGIPVPDTTYSVTFRLYAAPSGGSSFWNETRGVTTRSGLFSVLLGSVTPIPGVPEAGELYLAMVVGGGAELSPRLRIASSAYSFLARKADTANYALAAAGEADNAWTRGTPDSVLYTVKALGIARGGAANMLYGANRFSHVNFGVACTTGAVSADLTGCTVGGGYANRATAHYATVAGGGANRAQMGYATVGGGSGNVASAERATVGGGRENLASGTNATVSGGKYTIASGYCATIGGGIDNHSTGSSATVAGGSGNSAAGEHSVVAGGFSGVAEGICSAVAGGFLNTAGGEYSTVAGGLENAARGAGSCAAGSRARANHAGSFAWGDSSSGGDDSVYTTGSNQFRVRARGGTWFYSSAEMTTGVRLAANTSSWIAVSRDGGGDSRPVDRKTLLDRVAALPVREYEPVPTGDGSRSIGLSARDFHAAFGYGPADGISNTDADGVLFAAVQALYEQNQALNERVAELESRLPDK